MLHLARAGWVRWRDEVPTIPPKPEQQVAAGRARARSLDDRTSGLDITEAGTKKSLAMYVVRDPRDVPGIARLGPDPLADDFTVDVLREILARAGRKQIKGVLRHQGTIAGIGNAYSDEILHAARMSPFKPANSLTDDELADAVRRDPHRARRRGGPLARARRQRAQGREEVATWRCTAGPASPARSAATPCARCRSPTPACSTAPPARPAASRWPTGGCPAC